MLQKRLILASGDARKRQSSAAASQPSVKYSRGNSAGTHTWTSIMPVSP